MSQRVNTLDKVRKLAATYVPQWRFEPPYPGTPKDPGSALGMLISDMLEQSAMHLDNAALRHRKRFLEMLRPLGQVPREVARSYVRFEPVQTGAEPIFIPAGTRLLASSDATEAAILFETTHGITSGAPMPTAVFATDRAHKRITQLADEEMAAFTAFSTRGKNLEHHLLQLGFADMPSVDIDGNIECVLALDVDDAAGGFSYLVEAGKVSFTVGTGEEAIALDAKWQEDGIVLKAHLDADVTLEKEELCGRSCYVLSVRSDVPLDIKVHGASLRFATGELAPEIKADGVMMSAEYLPLFGRPMQLMAQCDFECKEVLDHGGADATLSFVLHTDVYEISIPEFEAVTDYKVIMRQPRDPYKMEPVQVKCDEAVFEYLSNEGWRRLFPEDKSTLFNGDVQGEVVLDFKVPVDMMSAEEAGIPRLRLRLLRAEGLYQTPALQDCPIIESVRMSCAFSEGALVPCVVQGLNNFEERDMSELLASGNAIQPWYSAEHERPCLYIGFDDNPQGTPASFYLAIDNGAEQRLDYTLEAFVDEAFVRIKSADHSNGMLNSGTLQAIIPAEVTRKALYGKELYWLRLVCYTPIERTTELPQIQAIYPNVAAVQNVMTTTEEFWLEDISSVTLSLGAQNLYSAEVYVNEADGNTDEPNWVLWESGEAHLPGRFYTLDLSAGRLSISRQALAAYPPRTDEPAVQVVYQTYHGSAANVGAGQIDGLYENIRGISAVSNPVAAYGGRDAPTDEDQVNFSAALLRTRDRAVTRADFYDIITTQCTGVQRVKCVGGVGPAGEPMPDAVCVAVLLEEYESGAHIFPTMRKRLESALSAKGALLPLGRELIVCQPRFVAFNVRIWLEAEQMEGAYDLQKNCADSIRRFLDPLRGGFEGQGFEIGQLPGRTQLIAYLKAAHPQIKITQMAMTASYANRELVIEDRPEEMFASPFVMAVNGEHTVHVGLG